MCAKATKDNNMVYYEVVAKPDAIEIPNPKNYVKLVDCSAELNAPPELDNHLRHLVPPAVRQMQSELKSVLDSIVNSEATKDQNFDANLNSWLRTFGLPGILSSVSASSEVPQEIWIKLEEFQRKGAAQNFAQSIEGAM